MAEALLRQIVSDPLGFNDRERQSIWNQKSQEGRWLHAVDLAFYRHYGIQFHQELSTSLPPAVQRRRVTVRDLLNHELKDIITARNKAAHGQWVWHLKSRQENDFIADRPPAAPNYVQINASKRLILSIERLVRILVISEPTFDRDFNKIEGEIDVFKQQLDGADYLRFESELQRTKRDVSSP
ncbi:hypothetical protein GS473_09455 [Rhodococcus hoagii]|nr:hypothetical protein [Prescottella equi]